MISQNTIAEFIQCGHLDNLSNMGTDVDRSKQGMPNSSEDDIRELEEAYTKLRDESQQLINERTSLEAEIRTLRKKVERLVENVNVLKTHIK